MLLTSCYTETPSIRVRGGDALNMQPEKVATQGNVDTRSLRVYYLDGVRGRDWFQYATVSDLWPSVPQGDKQPFIAPDRVYGFDEYSVSGGRFVMRPVPGAKDTDKIELRCKDAKDKDGKPVKLEHIGIAANFSVADGDKWKTLTTISALKDRDVVLNGYEVRVEARSEDRRTAGK